jgi:hypothetical protein
MMGVLVRMVVVVVPWVKKEFYLVWKFNKTHDNV